MTTEEMQRLMLAILGEYENTTREIVRDKEKYHPAVADAYWAAVWAFHMAVLNDWEFLVLSLKQAKYAKDTD